MAIILALSGRQSDDGARERSPCSPKSSADSYDYIRTAGYPVTREQAAVA